MLLSFLAYVCYAIVIASRAWVNRALTKVVWGEADQIFTVDASMELLDLSSKKLQAHDAQIVASMLPKCTYVPFS